MNDRIKDYLRHSAGPQIESWGKPGTDAYKRAKHEYNIGYYQRNKSKWNNKISDVLSTARKVAETAIDAGAERVSAAKDLASVGLDQVKNQLNYDFGNTGEIDYTVKTVINSVKGAYLSDVVTGQKSVEGYKFIKNFKTNVAAMATKVKDLWTSGMASIKRGISKLFS